MLIEKLAKGYRIIHAKNGVLYDTTYRTTLAHAIALFKKGFNLYINNFIIV